MNKRKEIQNLFDQKEESFKNVLGSDWEPVLFLSKEEIKIFKCGKTMTREDYDNIVASVPEGFKVSHTHKNNIPTIIVEVA